MSTTETEHDIINNYLLNINIPRDMSVPLEIYIAFPETLKDENAREMIRKQWLYGNDKQVASMDLMFKDNMTAICRPVGLLIDYQNMMITLVMPSGLQVLLPPYLLDQLGKTTEERISNLNDYCYIKFSKGKGFLKSDTIIPLRGKVSMEIAKEILDNSKYSPLEIILLGLGYTPTNEVKRLYLPRIATWFKGFDGKPLHVAQFTLPESGKTSFGIRNETLFNWKYIPEPPTLARLILDARSGVLGEVFLRNGICFDEFDKWTVDTTTTRATFDAILTGMEQGKWERGVSAMGVRVPDIPRLIPMMFFGNLGDFGKLYGAVAYNSRAYFNTIYTARLSHDVRALCDRLAIVDACFTQIRIMDCLTYSVLPDSVLRGIQEILQKDVKPCNVSMLKGRLKRHGNNLYAIFKTVFKDITPEITDAIVGGTLDLDRHMLEKKEIDTEIPKRDEYPSFPEA